MGFLDGRVAVVTGGSKGIGRGIAEALLAEDAAVFLTARHGEQVTATVTEFQRQHGDRVAGQAGDVRRFDEVEQFMNAAAEQFGGIDILVNNAGMGVFAPVAEMSLDDWHAIIETNLTGVFYCCKAGIPHLKRRGGGYIINISSLAGKNAFPGSTAYCASKFGLNGFSEALMQEVRYDGIRVSYIMPGSVETAFGGDDRQARKRDWALRPEDVAQVVVDLLRHPGRSLPSRVEIRPSQPPRKN